MELNTDQGFIIQNEGNGGTEILINQNHLRGVFVGVRSTNKLREMFMLEKFDPYLCMLATLKYMLPEFANKLMVLLKRPTNKISVGLIEAISPDNIIRVMKGKISGYDKLARIQCSTFMNNPQMAEQIKVNIYFIVSGKTPTGYVFVDPNDFKNTSINIIRNPVAMAG